MKVDELFFHTQDLFKSEKLILTLFDVIVWLY